MPPDASHDAPTSPAHAPSSTEALLSAPGAAVRDRVTRLLARRAETFPDMDLAPLSEQGLEPRDRALAHAIVDGAGRHWLTLAYLLDRTLKTPFDSIEPKLRAVLMCGSAQLALLDRVPAHACIDLAVEWAKVRIRPGAGGLVNAVLRRMSELTRCGPGESRVIRPRWSSRRDEIPLSDGTALALAHAVLPDGPELLSIAASMPQWLIARWTDQFGAEEARRLVAHGLVQAPLILNTTFASAETMPAEWRLTPHEAPGHMVVAGARDRLAEFLGRRDDLWAQDPTSSKAASLASHLAPSLIIDLCAGQGTKTRQLARMFPRSTIVACEPNEGRLRTLRQAMAANPAVRVMEPREAHRTLAGKADLVVLDVPCSNTGVLARRIEARYRDSQSQLQRLVAVQREIIRESVKLLGPGGHILYSTCSIEPEENERQASWATGACPLKIVARESTVPHGEPGSAPEHYRDGGFAALLALTGQDSRPRDGRTLAPTPTP